ncbi:hypothetical protein MAR_ORF087 [Marseillevirus marseillevirus]|uniref:Uncharacterized protein n=1 Tax=Marseillevirus marseillevirus TaxID=694581 RepID=D2XA95_GBMV|nr:hypothetical protein MAR_ORF087 [Marseillevirus marseillevirus]ADB03872.1 hypothetical protein MAR_ORF087 [Marseillevirus marseillevirus]
MEERLLEYVENVFLVNRNRLTFRESKVELSGFTTKKLFLGGIQLCEWFERRDGDKLRYRIEALTFRMEGNLTEDIFFRNLKKELDYVALAGDLKKSLENTFGEKIELLRNKNRELKYRPEGRGALNAQEHFKVLSGQQ